MEGLTRDRSGKGGGKASKKKYANIPEMLPPTEKVRTQKTARGPLHCNGDNVTRLAA